MTAVIKLVILLVSIASSAPAHHSTTISFTPSIVAPGGNPIVGYNAYRGTTHGGPYTRLNLTP